MALTWKQVVARPKALKTPVARERLRRAWVEKAPPKLRKAHTEGAK